MNAAAKKPQLVRQGKIIVESDGCGGFLILYPTGDVEGASNRSDVERRAKRYFKGTLGRGWRIGVGEIEWRK